MMFCGKQKLMLVLGMALGILCGALGLYLVSGVEAHANLVAGGKKPIGISAISVLESTSQIGHITHYTHSTAAYILYEDGSIERKSISSP
jgi:hypothetical protein